MAVRNQSWYDLNESRPWPISDEASAVDDAGTRFPGRAIADLHISFPDDVAQRVFISAVAITPTLATVTLLGTDSVSSPASFVPLAAISLAKPFDAYRMQTLEALYPGVGGWIVFSTEAANDDPNVEQFHARFSTPAQSIIHPSCAKAYRALPVPNIGKLGEANPLTGLVRLSGGNDMEVVKECREIPLVPGTGCDPNIAAALDVIVIRLKENVTATAVGAVAPPTPPTDTNRNVFDIYKGPCAGRPESISCGEPRPIELLASVPPDCCGNIDIVLRGCATPSRVTEEALVENDIVQSTQATCGVVIDCALSLAEACITPDRLPDTDGRLPNEYDDLCVSASEISITLPPTVPIVEESFSVGEESESVAAAAAASLPYCNDFQGFNSEISAGDFVIKQGSFNLIVDTQIARQVWSTEGLTGQAFRNVSVLDTAFDTFYKRAVSRFEILAGSEGNLHNAAIVANYRETSPGSNLFSYYVAEVDYDGHYNGYKLFRIGRFNGTSWSTEFAVPVPTLAVGNRYEIYLTIQPSNLDDDAAWITAQLLGIDDSINITVGPLLENNYTPSNGKFGLATNRSATRFHNFRLENTSAILAFPALEDCPRDDFLASDTFARSGISPPGTMDNYAGGSRPTPPVYSVPSGTMTTTVGTGKLIATSSAPAAGAIALIGVGTADLDLIVDIEFTAGSTAEHGILYRYTDNDNFFLLSVSPDNNWVRFIRSETATFFVVAQHLLAIDENTPYELRVFVEGDTHYCYVDGCLVFAPVIDSFQQTEDPCGFRVKANTIVELDNFRVDNTDDGRPVSGWLASDSFDRANNQVTIGQCDNYLDGGSLSPAPTWVQQSSTWEILDNHLEVLTISASPYGIISIETLEADVTIEAELTLVTPTAAGIGTGIMFRYMDNTHFWVASINAGSNVIRIVKRDGAAENTIASQATTINLDQSYKLRVELLGDSIKFYVDGVLNPALDITDVSYQTETIHGFRSIPQSQPEFDNFRVKKT